MSSSVGVTLKISADMIMPFKMEEQRRSYSSKFPLGYVAEGSSAQAISTIVCAILIEAALEKAGVKFIAENGGGPSVRLEKARHAATKPKKGD